MGLCPHHLEKVLLLLMDIPMAAIPHGTANPAYQINLPFHLLGYP